MQELKRFFSSFCYATMNYFIIYIVQITLIFRSTYQQMVSQAKQGKKLFYFSITQFSGEYVERLTVLNSKYRSMERICHNTFCIFRKGQKLFNPCLIEHSAISFFSIFCAQTNFNDLPAIFCCKLLCISLHMRIISTRIK